MLYRASLERMQEAFNALDGESPALALYLGGLAVESILQAWALREGAAPDARHSLDLWLKKCPPTIQDKLKSEPVSEFWNRLLAEWTNDLRYLDWTALLGRARKTAGWRRLRGKDDARMRQFAKGFVDAAKAVHNQGIATWPQGQK